MQGHQDIEALKFHEDWDFVLLCCIPRAWHSAWHIVGTQKINWWEYILYDDLYEESAVMDVGIVVTPEEIMTGKEHKGTRWGL